MRRLLTSVYLGLGLCAAGYLGQHVRAAEDSYRTATADEARAAIGAARCMACQVVGTGNCPSGTVPNPENECRPQTVLDCTYTKCYNCNAAAGTKYKLCFAFASKCCRYPSPWFSSTCGNKTWRGCSLTTIPATACSCPGGYVATTSPCPTDDCVDSTSIFCP